MSLIKCLSISMAKCGSALEKSTLRYIGLFNVLAESVGVQFCKSR